MSTTTTAQSRMALATANDRRLAAADLRRRITDLPPMDGRSLLAGLLRDPDDVTGTCHVGPLLLAVRRIGPDGCRLLLDHAGVRDPRRRVRELTPRQREALAYALEHPALTRPETGMWREPRGCCPRCGQGLPGGQREGRTDGN